MIVAAYLRVSTDEQTTRNQRPEIEALCARRGWTVKHWYEETGSAAKKRPKFAAMLHAAELTARPFEAVVIWRLDRFGRSLISNMDDVRRLDRAGVGIVSVGESWLDTTEGPLRHLLVSIFSYVAEMERVTLVERTKAGLRRAVAEGVKLGRPRVSVARLERAAALVASGATVDAACQEAEVSPSSLKRWRAGQKGFSGSAG